MATGRSLFLIFERYGALLTALFSNLRVDLCVSVHDGHVNALNCSSGAHNILWMSALPTPT